VFFTIAFKALSSTWTLQVIIGLVMEVYQARTKVYAIKGAYFPGSWSVERSDVCSHRSPWWCAPGRVF
jgi:hypothetical protein